MAMTYTSLIGSKGTAGAIATWTNYTLLDVVTIVDEAQALIYSLLRTREMLSEYNFSMAANNSFIALNRLSDGGAFVYFRESLIDALPKGLRE